MTARDLARTLRLRRSDGEYRGACPACGYADTFCLTERDGRVLGWCASCGDQRAIGSLLRAAGAGAPRLAPAAPRARERPSSAKKTAFARELWDAAVPAAGTLVATYLASRALPGEAERPALRFLARCPHPNVARLPAMLARVDDERGELVAVHRTYLRGDGSGKADVDPPKATLGPCAGAAIRLAPAAPALVIAEGIETALSAGRMLGLPAWSGIAAGNIERTLILPPEVGEVVIAADADANGVGQRSARAARDRWRAEGRQVRIVAPIRAEWDFNDLIRAEPADEQ